MNIRKSEHRGYADHGWLKSYHSFSFADYFDRNFMHFSALRVINDDVIAAGQGFGMHPHRDMEIITYMLEGQLRHHDSMGNGSVIVAGDVQRMTAGTGVMHSEFNASNNDRTHLLQIWVMPDTLNLAPSYEEKHFSRADKLNRFCLIAAKNPAQGVIRVMQDLKLFASVIEPGKELNYELNQDRSAYLHLARGCIEISGQKFETGDALMISGEHTLNLVAGIESEVLLFDLPLHQPLGNYKH